MPSPSQFLPLRRALLLAVSALTLTSLAWAQNSATPTAPPPAPASETPSTAAPGTPLPAAGGNQEPGDDKSKTPPQSAPLLKSEKPASFPDLPLPPIKPMVVNAERDAEIGHIVGKLVEQDHYLQVPISAEMSQRWLKNYLLALDYNHLFFLQSDVDEFTAKYGNTLGDLLLHNDDEDAAVAPAFEIFNRYLMRVKNNVALAEKLARGKYDFTKDESFTIPTDKSPWLKDAAYSDNIWRGQVKADLLNGLLDKKDPADTVKRLEKRYDSLLREREEMDDMDVLELYLSALTHAYDPHSDYFQPDEAQNFNIQAIDHAVTGIGAILKSDDGYATIDQIIAGGPADVDKRLQAGDRILAVGQGTKEPVDAVNMKLNRVVDMIRGVKGTTVRLVVLPAGATESAPHKEIVLKRDMVSIKDSLAKADIIQHQLPNGTMEKLGVIVLHDFYNNPNTHHSAASDVAELINRLKKENVSGIILDLRNNGGGLLDQAIELTGLFVKKEDVVQVRRNDGEIDQLAPDENHDIYNGPLLVMVNKASASATEIVAGALQDYGRAVIVGDQSTHGKGTVQTLIPLDQVAPIGFVGDPGKLKLTVQKFYRVAGGSTQQKGVIPDIIMPSLLDGFELGETTLKYYLPYDTVPPAPFDYLNLAAPYVPDLNAKAQARIAASPDFKYVRQDIAYYKKKVQDTTVSLNLATRLKEKADLKAQDEARKKDLLARQSTRDKELELTLDMVDKDQPAAPPVEKKPKTDTADDDSDDPDADLNANLDNPTDDPQLDEAVRIMCDYTQMLHDSGSKLVQNQPTK
jgi:carboxyl-terminal processing protease